MTIIRGLSYARIHNAIIAVVRDGTFHGIAWDEETKLITVSEDAENEVSPASCFVNEVRASFDDAIRNRRQRAHERKIWRFKAIVKFDGPTSVEKFEQSVTHSPLQLVRDPQNNLPQVDFALVDATYDHKHHEASRGSEVTFLFDVTLSPV